ncbi:MAG: hypothetical protein JJT82_04940 [Legionellaceae bacterium]|nr:hypothetical protein [Legionellaceae bacterium]
MRLSELRQLEAKKLKHVVTLSLENTDLNVENLEYLAQIAPHLLCLEFIDCRNLKLGDKKFPKTLDVFALCPAVAQVRMDGNKLTEGCVDMLVTILPKFPSLVSLDLSENKIEQLSRKKMALLLEAIQNTPSLFHLNFGNIDLDKGALTKALEENMSKSQQLLSAVANNDEKKVLTCLKQGAYINSLTYLGRSPALKSPLHIAVEQVSVKMVRLLLKKGARPTLRNGHNQSPLEKAKLQLEKLGKVENDKTNQLETIISVLSKGPLLRENSRLLQKRPSRINLQLFSSSTNSSGQNTARSSPSSSNSPF